jgi:hypothetical protein
MEHVLPAVDRGGDERRPETNVSRVSAAGPAVASSQIRLTFSPTKQHSPRPPRQAPRPPGAKQGPPCLFCPHGPAIRAQARPRRPPSPSPTPKGGSKRRCSRSRLSLFPGRSEMRVRECDREAAASPHAHTVLSDPPDNVKWPNESSVVRSLPTWGLFTASPVCCVVNDTLSSVPPPLVFSLAFPHR